MTPMELQLMREMQNMRFAAVIFRFLAQPEQEPYGLLNTATGVVRKSWEGTGYVGDLVEVYTTPPQRKPLTDEQMQFLATAIGQAQQIIDTHNAEFVTARDDLRRCAELLAANGNE